MPDRPEIVCICGSTRFAEEMLAANRGLTLAGDHRRGTRRRRERAAIGRESVGSARDHGGMAGALAAFDARRPSAGQAWHSLFCSGDRSTRETAC